MIRYVFSVRDLAQQAFFQPTFLPTLAVARRSFSDEVNRAGPENPLYQHPEDFELHCLASWDDETGVFSSECRALVARGKEVVSMARSFNAEPLNDQ